MKTPRQPLLRLLAGFLLVAGAWTSGAAGAAEPNTRLLGADGDVLQVVEGSLGDLFGVDTEDASNPALALDILRSDSIDRLLIPGTDGPDQEVTPTALFESESSTLYLAWTTRFNLIHTKITVLWYRNGAFSPPIELAGSAFTEKTSPRIAFTRETYQLLLEDGTHEQHTRSIVHTLWAETNGVGQRVAYTPIVFIDGEPLESIAELTLDPQLLAADATLGTNEVVPFLPTLRRSTSPRRLFATLSDDQLLSVLSIEPVPVELTRLGDGVRASIVPIGRIVCGPGDGDGPLRLASAVREDIFSEGSGLFHESVLEHIASAAESAIVRAGEATCRENAPALAETVFEEILSAGTDALDSGRIRVGSGVRASIVPIGRSRAATVGELEHLIRVGRASAHRLPPLRVGRSHVIPSSDGRHLLVAWEEADGLVFQETSATDGWTEPSSLRLDSRVDLDDALRLLERRAAGR